MTEQSPADRSTAPPTKSSTPPASCPAPMPPFSKALYAQYLANPSSVDADWQAYFAGLGEQGLTPTQLGRGPAWRRDQKPATAQGRDHRRADRPGLQPPPKPRPRPARQPARRRPNARAAAQDSIRAIQLVRAYRVIGHLEADLDPLQAHPAPAASAARSGLLRLPRRGDGQARSSSTACWAWKPPRRARSSTCSSAPIAAASAMSSCTSTMPSRRTGCSAASKGRTRTSPSPPKARRRSSTS